MEKTFNLHAYLSKTASMSYEGSQGYFLAQQRAWMNCSKCKRTAGKTAHQAWEECFDEFQEGDRKLSWIESYAKDEAGKVAKESAIDYSDDIVKLASNGMAVGAAVTTALQQRLAALPRWLGGKGKDPAASSVPSGFAPKNPSEAPSKAPARLPAAAAPAVATDPYSSISDAAIKARQQKNPRVNAGRLQNEKITYDHLLKIKQLVEQDQYDTGAIRKLIAAIPINDVRDYFGRYIEYLTKTEIQFDAKIRKMVADAEKLMIHYESGRKGFRGIQPQTPKAKVPAAAGSKETIKMAQANNRVLRIYDRNADKWTYFGGQEGQMVKGASLTSAERFSAEAASGKIRELAAKGAHYISVKDDEGDWSAINSGVKTADSLSVTPKTKAEWIEYMRSVSPPMLLDARRKGAIPDRLMTDRDIAFQYKRTTGYDIRNLPLMDCMFEDCNLPPAEREGLWVAKSRIGLEKDA